MAVNDTTLDLTDLNALKPVVPVTNATTTNATASTWAPTTGTASTWGVTNDQTVAGNLTGLLAENSRYLGLGFVTSPGLNSFDGAIDEVRIYNRVITLDEVKQLYRMGALPKGIK